MPGSASSRSEPLLLYLVKQVELAARARLDDIVRPTGLTSLQYTALTVLERNDDMTSAALARNSFVTAQSMADMVSILESHGFIERRRDASDRRRLLVGLTPAGRALLDRCRAEVIQLESCMVSGLSSSEVSELRRVLRACHRNLAQSSQVLLSSGRLGLWNHRQSWHDAVMETPLSPLEFMRRTRSLHGAREAVIDGSLRLTYEQFFDRCDRWSAVLQKQLGVRQGDRVATIAPNTHAQLEAFYSVPALGGVLVPMNYRLAPDDFVYMINHSGSAVVCVHSDYLDAIDGVRDQLPDVQHFVAFEGGTSSDGTARDGWVDYEALISAAGPDFDRPSIAETDLLTINYTSGTTSRPKGVMITHRNAAMNSINTLLHLRIGIGDGYLWTLPMFHANGWTFTWTVTAAAGKHVCLRKVDPATIFGLIRDENVRWMSAAPTVLISLANAPDSVRGSVVPGVQVATAGAPPAAATIERLEGNFGWEITQMYGLTETSPFITTCAPLPEHAALPPSDLAVVKARTGVELIASGEIRVVGDSGQEVPWDGATLGEITVRGNVVMKGYYNDPAATEKAMGDGWFHTGDAAVVHPDGYLEIRDRIKDVIISGGENISSIEVEGAILRHPAVDEVAVVGLPSEKWGETPHAFVVLLPGAILSADELMAFVRERIAHYKVPRGVSFVDELPKTATGKIQKFVLRGGANLQRQ